MIRLDDRRRRELTLCAGLLVALAAAFALPAPEPGSPGLVMAGLTVPSGCPFHAFTGLPCPFCGLTRSMVSLAHGELESGISFHPAGPAVFLFLVFQLWYRSARLALGERGFLACPRLLLMSPSCALALALAATWMVRLADFSLFR